jgi:hypothetical protein
MFACIVWGGGGSKHTRTSLNRFLPPVTHQILQLDAVSFKFLERATAVRSDDAALLQGKAIKKGKRPSLGMTSMDSVSRWKNA